MNEQPLFDFIHEHDAQQEREKTDNGREENIKSCRICWPEWNGPKVHSPDMPNDQIDGYCEVGQCIVYSITHGEPRYHYCAPCKIIEVHQDHVVAVVDYDTESDHPGTSGCAKTYNGEKLRIDLWEIWPPTARIRAWRDKLCDFCRGAGRSCLTCGEPEGECSHDAIVCCSRCNGTGLKPPEKKTPPPPPPAKAKRTRRVKP